MENIRKSNNKFQDFQKGKSTEHAIFPDLYFNIITANEKQEKSAYIFLDFAKAFDTVNYEIFLCKLDKVLLMVDELDGV